MDIDERAKNYARTRIVCISDTHNCNVKLPAGDVLIHAGDLTNQGSYAELARAVKWIEAADFEIKIVVAGNHDITLDEDFYAHHGQEFHNQEPQSPADCLALLTNSPSITYLYHDSAKVRLKSPTGPHTEFTVFGSPYSRKNGHWAFYYDAPQDAESLNDYTSLWDLIPLEADIVVTHTPPNGHCDFDSDPQRPRGCEALRRALWRVRPRLAVCGHLHQGRGSERVVWDLWNPDHAFAEKESVPWIDPGEGNKKQSRINYSEWRWNQPNYLGNNGEHTSGPRSSRLGRIGYGADTGFSDDRDFEALQGRYGRKETCVVNAAILASNYPHKGGKKLNKPIVVDLSLPVWRETDK